MARLASVLIPTATIAANSASDIVVALAAGVASAVLAIPKNAIFVINYQPTAASQTGVHISFGNSATSIVAPTGAPGNCYSIPPNQQTTFDMGLALNQIQLLAEAAGNVYIKILSVN